MSLIAALVRRTAIPRVLLSQVRTVRSQRSALEDESGEEQSLRRTKTPRVLVGQIVEEKFEKFPEKRTLQLKEPPPTIDLIPPEPPKDPVPEPVRFSPI